MDRDPTTPVVQGQVNRPETVDGGVEVGSIDPTSGWTKAATMRLPDTMPLQLQVFIVCVVAIQWRRMQASSA
jgi:hypothetical protein